MAEQPQKSALFTPLAAGGRYEVGEEIASGGMGTVYRGFDKLAQRPVAYKRMRVTDESNRPRMAALFQREYDTLTHLTHPNIVEAYDFGFDASGPYYTMELLSGDDLAKLAPLPFREACRLLRDVASALALLHARRLVHRDVSPRNVCLTLDGRAKLIDFGALIRFGKPAEIVGTPAFIAPECLTATALDQRTDLYALGALAYWLLTQRTHVQAPRIHDLLDAWQEPVLAPSRFAPDLPQALDDVVLSLLQKQASARPASAAHVIEQLTTIANLAPEQDPRRVAYSYLQRPPLVGRADTVSELQRALKSALAGSGGVVLLEAAAGLGRSSLLDDLAVEAQIAGAAVLRAGAGLHKTPFSAAHALVHTGLATFPALGTLMRERSSQFVRLIAPQSEDVQVRSSIEASERQAATSSLLQDALMSLSECAPLVLLIDDSHGVDAESLALLASMVELIRGRPILLVLSAHIGQVAQDPQVRARLLGHATRLGLSSLSEPQLNELIQVTFAGVPNCASLSAWLFAQAGGNPAHSMDLVRLLLAQEAIRYTLGTFTLPYKFEPGLAGDSRAAALLAQLSGASAEARALASLFAVHGGALKSDELASARGSGTREVMLAIEELVQRGAVVSQADSFCCASEALRSAVTSALTADQKRAHHIALARAVARRQAAALDDVLATAEHLLAAGGAERLEGAYLLAHAAEQHKFSLGMRPASLRLLEVALEVLGQHGVPERDCIGLLVSLSMAGFYGDIAGQRRYLDRALDALSSICGLALARRLSRWVGPQLALWLGLLVAFCAHLLKRRGLTSRPFVEHLESLTGVTGPATAAAACSFDAQEAWRVVAWLEPLAAAPRRSPLFFMREFCVATAELVSAKFGSAAQRYSQLVSVYEQRVLGIDEKHATQIRSGCLNGWGQALVTDTDPEALALADRLDRDGGGAFFAPHAEGLRSVYHAYRGEAELAAAHRERAERLSLQAGTCWSAMSVLTVRGVLVCVLTGDVIGLVRVISDLEQLAKLSVSLTALHELALAHLDLMRGMPEQALARYERVFAGEVARNLPTYAVERTLQAQALSALGKHAAARTLCLALLDELDDAHETSDMLYYPPRLTLALAEARLGDCARAVELLEVCFARNGAHANPLLLGTLHRDRAQVAVLAGDAAAFERHFAAMAEHFRATQNPLLRQQCDALRAQAARSGVCAPAPEPELPPTVNDPLSDETEFERPGPEGLARAAASAR